MEFDGIFSMEFHGVLGHGFPWSSMEFIGIFSMEFHGVLGHGFPWNSMEYCSVTHLYRHPGLPQRGKLWSRV